MIRNYKAFGLALVAMLAFGAFAAQGASASPLTCEGLALGAKCFSTGDQDGGLTKFKTAGGEISCTEVSYRDEGTVTSASGGVNEVTVTPSYPTEKSGGGNNCTAFGFAGAHITTTGCNFTLTTPTKIKAGEVTWDTSTGLAGEEAQVHLVCETGKSIQVTPTAFGASVCTQTIEAQTPTMGHVIGTNAGTVEKMDVTLNITLSNIHYKGTGSSCGNSETHTDASLTGGSTVKCYSDSAHTKQINCTFS